MASAAVVGLNFLGGFRFDFLSGSGWIIAFDTATFAGQALRSVA
jgi:hypothetical protein